MKTYLALIAATALVLSACGGEKPAEPAKPAAEASANTATATATASASDAAPAAAASGNTATAGGECAVTVNSDDKMTFDTKEINVKSSCKDFTITLKHTGTMPKAGMGHNMVITKASDKDGVMADGSAAGAEKDYLKPDDAMCDCHHQIDWRRRKRHHHIPCEQIGKRRKLCVFLLFPRSCIFDDGQSKFG